MGTIADLLNTAMRDFQRYTGDGLPNEPAGRPLPVGDPASGQFNPPKKQVRDAFISIAETADELVATAELVAADRLQTELDRDAAQLSASTALTYRDQAQIAAIAAGAPLVFVLPDPVPADGSVRILQTSAGSQVWRVESAVWVHKGWLGTPAFPSIAAMAAATGFLDGQYVDVESGFNNKRERFIFDIDSTRTANGTVIVDATGMGAGRFVSSRTSYTDFDEVYRQSFFKFATVATQTNPIVLVGDSLTSGEAATDYATNSFASILRSSVQEHFGNRNFGFLSFNDTAPGNATTSLYTITKSGFTVDTNNGVLGGYIAQSSTAGDWIELTYFGRDIYLMYARFDTTGSVDVALDGVEVATIDTSLASPTPSAVSIEKGRLSARIPVAKFGWHTIRFTAVGDGTVQLLGTVQVDNNLNAPAIWNMGRSGQKLTELDDSVLEAYASSGASIFALGVNDANSLTSVITFRAKLKIFLNKVKLVGGRTLMLDLIVSLPADNAYKTILREEALNYGVPLIDFGDLWRDTVAQNQFINLVSPDGIHLTNQGHRFVARPILTYWDIPMVQQAQRLLRLSGTIPVATGWTADTVVGYPSPYYSVVGDQVILSGMVENTSGSGAASGTLIGTLPKFARPTGRQLFIVIKETGSQRVEVRSDGGIYISSTSLPDSEWLTLGGISFSTSTVV